ncbi:helix-turn-helix domain-containing protein [Streptomyces sp. NPDC050504]|uniref:AraC-like ligand-binding domain-containing protein n=1 Tax=Streptomyces sp. NPDC050504 TaxID=3365618 RepID=UPI00379DF625
MGLATLHSTCVPPEQRFDWWRDLISQDVAPTRITSAHVDDFPASAGSVQLGSLQLTSMSFPAIRSERTPALIRRSDPEVYELTLITGSEMWISQARNETRMKAGDLVMWNTSRPFDGRGLDGSGDGISRAIILHLPRADMPVPAERLDGLLAHSMPTDRGMAAVLARFLRSLVAEAPFLTDRETARLGPVTWELVAAFLADRLNANDRVPPEARNRMLLARIDAFIEDNLSHAALSPSAVAAHHHISVRTLHALFRARSRTVSAAIRHRRLEHCRADLEDPRMRGVPVHAIAARWGLPNPSAFNRAFLTEYGVTPGEYRRTVTGPAPAAERPE